MEGLRQRAQLNELRELYVMRLILVMIELLRCLFQNFFYKSPSDERWAPARACAGDFDPRSLRPKVKTYLTHPLLTGVFLLNRKQKRQFLI
jgi:hypothetical protein